MEERDFRGIWIPAVLWLDKNFSVSEKVVLCEIDSYDRSFGCIATNKTLSKNLNIDPKTVSGIIKSLGDKQAIFVTYEDMNNFSGRRISVLYKPLLISRPPSRFQEAVPMKQEGGLEKSEPNSNTFSNTISNLNINVDSKKSTNKTKKEPHPSFVGIVDFYCKEYWPNYKFMGARDGKQINEIIEQIERLFVKNNRSTEPEEITEFFRMVIKNLPKFYQFKNLTKINSGFSEIVEEIKTSRNGQPKQESAVDKNKREAREYRDYLRSRASGSNSSATI